MLYRNKSKCNIGKLLEKNETERWNLTIGRLAEWEGQAEEPLPVKRPKPSMNKLLTFWILSQ